MTKHTVEITNEDFTAAYNRFLAVMELKDNWNGILEFVAMFGVDSLSFKKNDDGESLYMPKTAFKVSKLLGESGETVIRAYKARRATKLGRLKAYSLRLVQPTFFLLLYINVFRK